MRRFMSADGLTKFVRTGVVAPFRPLLTPAPAGAAGAGGGAWCAGAPAFSMGAFDALDVAPCSADLVIGTDLPGFTPWVRRIDGVSACGLNAMDELGGRLTAEGWLSRSAFRPVTNPSGIPGGG